jgi:hypothetical protein
MTTNWASDDERTNNNHVNAMARRRGCSGAPGRKGGKAVFFTCFTAFSSDFFSAFFSLFFSLHSFIRLSSTVLRYYRAREQNTVISAASASAHPHHAINQQTTTIPSTERPDLVIYDPHIHAVSQTTTPHDTTHDDHTLAHDRGKRRELGGLGGW